MPRASASDLPLRVRRHALAHQGLLHGAPFGRGKPGTLKALTHLGYVQIDTISVVSRAHDHVLFNRVPGYQPKHLHRLVEERQAFEYWHHAASYLPMSAYRFARVRMEEIQAGKRHWMRKRDKKMERFVLDRIRAEGPLMARDFDAPNHKSTGWWEWKPAKKALEQLFMQGDLTATARVGFQKVYDLTERVIPSSVDTRVPTAAEHAAYLIDQVLDNFGVVTHRAATYLQRSARLRTACREMLKLRLDAGELVQVDLDHGQPLYARPGLLDQRLPSLPNRIQILSPFDHSVIQRDRCQNLLDFDYQIECYVPAAKRQYGYFCLPLLYQDRFIGRMDCKAHRDKATLEIVALSWEADVLADLGISQKTVKSSANAPALTNLLTAFTEACKAYAQFNGCEEVSLTQCRPGFLTRPITAQFKQIIA